jgi:EmrB/QacA subfamily drug resistance transporter
MSTTIGTGRASITTLVGLILAVSMTTIDQTIVALSAPTIQNQLGLSHDGIQWAVNVYLLTTAAFFLLGGRLADVFGHKRMALIGIAGFGLTSLLCGLAPTGDFAEAWLVIARALQGVSGAIMFPAAIGIVVQAFPKERRGRMMAVFFTITGAMTAIGPTAGGFLTPWTWRSIFWINVPIAIAAFIIVAISARPATRRRESIDWLGVVLAAFGMAGLIFGLQQSSAWGWNNPAIWASLVLGAALLVTFIVVERRTKQPLIRLEAFRDRGFTVSVLASLIVSIAFVSMFFFLSVYGQVSLGLSAGLTGLLLLKFFIGFVIGARFGSRMFDRVGARRVILIGGLIGAFGFAWLASTMTNLDFDKNAFINQQTWPIVIAGVGIGFMLSAVSTDAVNRAVGASYGEVTAISQTMRNFGGALGLAIFSTLVTSQFTSKLIESFHGFGGTTAQAKEAVNLVSGASSEGHVLGGVPSTVQHLVISAVQQDYAASAQLAFFGMAGAMAALVVLSFFYPRTKTEVTSPAERELVAA